MYLGEHIQTCPAQFRTLAYSIRIMALHDVANDIFTLLIINIAGTFLRDMHNHRNNE